MVTIPELQAYAEKLLASVPEINYQLVVVDDSQLVDSLSDIAPEDNHLLYVVIPSMNSSGAADAAMTVNQMLFLVLQKSDDSVAHEDFLKVMADTQISVRKIEIQMFMDKMDSCGLMARLDEDSIEIDPVWGLSGCNGWSMKFILKTSI